MHHQYVYLKRFSFLTFVVVVGSFGLYACGNPVFQDPNTQSQYNSLRSPTQVYFELPKDGTFTKENFYNFPYPHSIRLASDGTPDLSGFPRPKREKKCSLRPTNNPTLDTLLAGVDPDTYINDLVKVTNEGARGFSLNPAIYFRFNRPIHKDSIPPVSATLTPDSAFMMINVDENSPHKGQLVPIVIHPGLKSRFLPDNMVVIRPLPGFVLYPKTTYAVVIRTTARDNESWPLQAHSAFAELASDSGPKDENLKKLVPTYKPMFSLLKEKYGIEAKDIAAATVFATGDPVSEQKDLQKFVSTEMQAPAPPKNMRCSSNATTTPYITCSGTYAAPQFQKGEVPYLDPDSGYFTYDSNKKPQYKLEDLRLVVTIPKRYMTSGAPLNRPIPIVMYAHGTGGSYRTVINNRTARRLAESGIASIGIDQALNGARTKTIAGTKLDFLFFNALNLLAARDNVRQSGIDYYWQARFIKTLKIEYKGQSFTFDKDRIWFMGHSQGGLTGPLLLAFEDSVKAAYLSAPGGFMIHTLLYKTKPAEPILLPEVINYILCDNKESHNVFHPILSLVQNFFDPADPVNYMPPILDGSRSPIHFFMTEGLKDQYAPPQVFEPLAIASQLPLLGPELEAIEGLNILQLPKYKLPVKGNYVHPNGTKTTVGFTQHSICKYSTGVPCDGHFVAFNNENALRNWITFFQSLATNDMPEVH